MSNNCLQCSASSCAYNKTGACYAGTINVAGSNATTTSSTYCSSYEDKSHAGFTSSNSGASCTAPTNISCEADKCKYNSSGACTATSVQINAHNASCETFVCR